MHQKHERRPPQDHPQHHLQGPPALHRCRTRVGGPTTVQCFREAVVFPTDGGAGYCERHAPPAMARNQEPQVLRRVTLEEVLSRSVAATARYKDDLIVAVLTADPSDLPPDVAIARHIVVEAIGAVKDLRETIDREAEGPLVPATDTIVVTIRGG